MGDVRIAVELAAAAQRLRRGVALNGIRRAQLVDLLWQAVLATLRRGTPPRPDADPAALVEIAVTAAREAGMSAPDIVETVNATLERVNRPAPLHAAGAR